MPATIDTGAVTSWRLTEQTDGAGTILTHEGADLTAGLCCVAGVAFKAPADVTQLDSVQFTWRAAGLGDPASVRNRHLSVRLRVMAWDEATGRATGSVLFESADVEGPQSRTPVPLTIVTGGVLVTSGAWYVAFLTTDAYLESNPWPIDPANGVPAAHGDSIALGYVTAATPPDFAWAPADVRAVWLLGVPADFTPPHPQALQGAVRPTPAAPTYTTARWLGTGADQRYHTLAFTAAFT
jgi:hypothetical protein